jgi:hypothetical protein
MTGCSKKLILAKANSIIRSMSYFSDNENTPTPRIRPSRLIPSTSHHFRD